MSIMDKILAKAMGADGGGGPKLEGHPSLYEDGLQFIMSKEGLTQGYGPGIRGDLKKVPSIAHEVSIGAAEKVAYHVQHQTFQYGEGLSGRLGAAGLKPH